MNDLSDRLEEMPLNQAVAKGLRMAEALDDADTVSWCRLELAGYWSSNPAISEQTVVPEYRSVVGQHADIYGRVLVLPRDLSFVNETRLRNGIEELEALARTRDVVVIHDPDMCGLIQEGLGVEVYAFRFSAVLLTGIFASIRDELRQRITRLEPMMTGGAATTISAPAATKEVLQLKPNLYGVGVDLRALWSRWKGSQKS